MRRDLTVPEGRSLDEIAALVAAEGLGLEAFLAAARDPAPVRDLDPAAADLEGYLFPDTYDLPQVAGGSAGARAADDPALPRGDRARARAHRGAGADGAAGRDPRLDRRARDRERHASGRASPPSS